MVVYISYRCSKCKGEFVLLKEQIDLFKGELTCPFCQTTKIRKQKVADNLKECMGERVYKRVNGALREKR